MIVKLSDNIFSPLGETTLDNYRRVARGDSELRHREGVLDLPEGFTASLFASGGIPMLEGHTRFESLAIASVARALESTEVDASSGRTLFVVSTTKGNVELLDRRYRGDYEASRVTLGASAALISQHFGNRRTPLVVSNACISGLCAQIAAVRAIESGSCDTAIVVGADVQSRFIISGFQSFKALSQSPCRPFDRDRDGLNLGEAAATIIYTKVEKAAPDQWTAGPGAIRNDANHISGPSRTGEGSYRALRAVTAGVAASDLAVINVHGTSTGYNDEMESIAIDRAGFIGTPVNSLKGYYGHTMGAAGVLEVALTMRALDHGTILGTRGFENLGVSRPVNVSPNNRTTDRKAFVKLLSGFGGCNAAMLFKKGGEQ